MKPTAFTPRPRAARQKTPSLVDVVLDPAQQTAVERPAGRALLILGEAGHGKTTVALHRLAHLWKASATPLRAALVVPTAGLARLTQPLLRKLGVDLEVLTYDRWACAQARRVFRKLPRERDGAPPSVLRLKRHPALRMAIEELARRSPGTVDDDRDAPPIDEEARATRGDLQHLFGDRELLENVARAARLPVHAVVSTLEHTRIQFSLTAEREWAQVTDRKRLVAVDHLALDDGTESAAASTLDVEDYAVLFELERLRTARQGLRPGAKAAEKMKRYDVLVLDEAQEFAPLELALLGRSLALKGTLVVAGDGNQQIDETTGFGGWANAMLDLGTKDYETVVLDVGYRCPPNVVALARGVLQARTSTGSVGRGEPSTPLYGFDGEGARGAWLAHELRALLRRDPRASIAVLCRMPRTARKLAESLQAGDVAARLVFDGRFLARGPVQVTTVDEVKGLEFDFVVVPDAGASDYPDTTASRRVLYVAVTRAHHQVVLARVGEASPLLTPLVVERTPPGSAAREPPEPF